MNSIVSLFYTYNYLVAVTGGRSTKSFTWAKYIIITTITNVSRHIIRAFVEINILISIL